MAETMNRNDKGLSPQHRALLKEARERLCLITGGIGALSPMLEAYYEVEAIIGDIESLLGVQ